MLPSRVRRHGFGLRLGGRWRCACPHDQPRRCWPSASRGAIPTGSMRAAGAAPEGNRSQGYQGACDAACSFPGMRTYVFFLRVSNNPLLCCRGADSTGEFRAVVLTNRRTLLCLRRLVHAWECHVLEVLILKARGITIFS